MDETDWIEANRRAWDEVAPRHEAHHFRQLLEQFRRPGFSCLGPVTTGVFESLGVRGKAVAQPCCNNGRELVSLRNLGAGRGTGFDLSAAFLDQAARLAAAAGVECEFIHCDVLAIPEPFFGCYEIVYVSVGTLRWIPDLPRFIGVVARLLRPGGHLFIHEMHPILDMFAPEPGNPRPALRRGYFDPAPRRSTAGLDYYGQSRYDALPAYHFFHTLGAIVEAVAERGLRVERLRESPHDISWAYTALARSGTALPMSYILLARKETRGESRP